MSQPQGQQQRTIPQSKEALLKSYSLKLREDTKSMLDNFTEIIKLARIEEESQIARSTQAEQDQYEMQVRAANIAAQKELRILKQEETTLVALASRISDQLNRLKVEELALQNMVRLQNEEQERHLRGSMSAGSSKMLGEQEDMDLEDDDDANKADLDLDVIGIKKMRKRFEEEEEEEEEDDDEEPHQRNEESLHQDIEQFVELL